MYIRSRTSIETEISQFDLIVIISEFIVCAKKIGKTEKEFHMTINNIYL